MVDFIEMKKVKSTDTGPPEALLICFFSSSIERLSTSGNMLPCTTH